MNIILSFILAFSIGAFAKDTKKAAQTATTTESAAVAQTTAPQFSKLPGIIFTPSETVFEEVTLSKSTFLADKNLNLELKPISYGIRKKKVFGLATVKVYVLEFAAADPSKLVKTEDGILASLKEAGAVQLKLTLTRDVGGSKISDSFKDSLAHNGVDIANPSKELGQLLNEVSSIKEFSKGQSFTLTAVYGKDSNATLYAHKPDGSFKVISGPSGFVHDLFSIWFGKPVDDHMENLKKTLLK